MSAVGFGPRLSVIPAAAVTDARLQGRDLQVLCLLGTHTNELGWCWRSQGEMARQVGCVRGTIQNALRRLEAAGWVEVRQRRRNDGGDASHAYRVVLDVSERQVLAARRKEPLPADLPEDPEPEAPVPEAPEAAEEGPSQGTPPANILAPPCQQIGTPLPTQGWHPPANIGLAPYNDKVLNDEILTSEPPLSPPEGRGGASANPDGGQWAGEPLPPEGPEWQALADLWPGIATNRVPRALKVWGGLTAAEKAGAIAGVPPYLAECQRHRRQVCQVASYLKDRRWLHLPQEAREAVAGGRRIVQPWSREWWAVWWARVRAKPTGGAFMAAEAAQGRPIHVPATEVPPDAEITTLVASEVGGELWRTWDRALHARRIVLPRPAKAPRAFLPPDPPTGGHWP